MNRLILSYMNTSFGFWLISFLVPLIVLKLSNSAFLVSVSYALNILPYIVITPFSGVICDIYNRKKIIMAGELLCCFTTLLLFFSLKFNSSVAIVIGFGFIVSSLSAMHHPVFQSLIPDLYKQDELKKINANIGVIDSTVSIIAPVILGALFYQFSQQTALLLVALCYLLSFITIFTIPYTRQVPQTKLTLNNIIHSLRQGVKYVYQKKELLNISCLFFFINMGIRVIFPNLIWIYSVYFKLNSEQTVLMFLIIGLGSITGTRIGAALIGRYTDVAIITCCSFLISLCSVLLLAANSALIHAIVWSLSSLVQSVIVVTYFTYRHKVTEPYILGTRLISYMAIPLASMSSGWVISTLNSINIIYIFSAVIIFFPLLFFWQKTSKKPEES
jgi:MFS transporter, DHA3 family, macrolide efflux protein